MKGESRVAHCVSVASESFKRIADQGGTVLQCRIGRFQENR